MVDRKLTFDADTAAYNAKVEESHRKTEKLLDVFKDMAEPLLKVVSIVGVIDAGAEAVLAKFEQWRENIEKAAQENKKIGTDLAAVVGSIGLLSSYSQIKSAVQSSQGVLSTDQKTAAIRDFGGAYPGASSDQVIGALGQSQKAAQVIGPENVSTFAQALGLAMQSGLKQDRAGDVAIAVTQSGSHGLEAFQRASAQFATEYTTPEARGSADFLKYLQNAGPDVFGNRPTQQLGGQAIQGRLRGLRPGELNIAAEQAPGVDEELAKQREIQAREARTATQRQQTYGGRAEAEEELDSLKAQRRASGDSFYDLPEFLLSEGAIRGRSRQLRQGLEPNRAAGGIARGEALREFARVRALNEVGDAEDSAPFKQRTEEIMIEVLRGIHRNTGEKAGAAKFRNDAQDRDKGEE